jgi:YD repeat-containing protein
MRSVNSVGTVKSFTDGRGKTYSYTYDDADRVKSIVFPKSTSDSVSITWSDRTRTLTRGAYKETLTTDGFGRAIRLQQQDTTNSLNINQMQRFDAEGRVAFVSLPDSTTQGETYAYDALGRVTRITHADGRYIDYDYQSGNKAVLTDENLNTITHTYRSYGIPDERYLVSIQPQEANTTLTIARNAIGLVTSVTQNGVVRSYHYESSRPKILSSLVEPETGTTNFQNDALGRVQSQWMGSNTTQKTQYTYDGLGRLIGIDYPETAGMASSDTQYEYNQNDDVISSTLGNTKRTYGYDDNENLDWEALSVDSLKFEIDYAYNSRDHLSKIIYPASTRALQFSPDALGRPTQIGGPVAGQFYARDVVHHPNGEIKSHVSGNNVTTNITQTLDRQFLDTIRVKFGTTALVSLDYRYDYTGNISSIQNGLRSNFSATLGYDKINRLTSVSSTGLGSGSITYNGQGDILTNSTSGKSLSYNYSAAERRLQSVGGSNSYTFAYDLYGNVTTDGVHDYAYDHAHNLRKYKPKANSTYNANFEYDADRLRVKQTIDGKTLYYLYSSNGLLIGEYDTAGVWQTEYVYLAGKLLARIKNTDGETPVGAPSIPASISAPSASQGSHTITWGASSGTVDNYGLEESVNGGEFSRIFQGKATNFNVTGRSDGAYSYRVRACNTQGCSGYRMAMNNVLVERIVSCRVRDFFVDTSVNMGMYSLLWNYEGSACESAIYEVQTANNVHFNNPSSQLVTCGKGTCVHNVTTSEPRVVFARVRIQSGGESDAWSSYGSVCVNKAVPPAPAITVPMVFEDYEVSMSWPDAGCPESVAYYNLEYATKADFSDVKGTQGGNFWREWTQYFNGATGPDGAYEGMTLYYRLQVQSIHGKSAWGPIAKTQRAYLTGGYHIYKQMFLRSTANNFGLSAMFTANKEDYTYSTTEDFFGSNDRFVLDSSQDWSGKLGDSNQDGILEPNGSDIPITAPGRYRVTLYEKTMRYTVTKENIPPDARAGADQTVSGTALATLDGTGSTDKDGQIVKYEWVWVSGSSDVILSNTSSAKANVQFKTTLPPTQTSRSAYFDLKVTDNQGATDTDRVMVLQKADAPVYQKTYAQVYTRGTHNAWQTSGMQLIGDYQWQADATFGSTATERFKFDIHGDWSLNFGDTNKDGTAEQAGSDLTVTQGAGTYRITFNDSTKRYTITKVGGTNNPPSADAGADQTVPLLGATVILDGSGSDPDGHPLTYAWKQLSGPTVALSNSAVAKPTVVIPSATSAQSYVFELTVTDNGGLSAKDTVQLTQTTSDNNWQRTVVFIYGQTVVGQDMFIRGGIDWTYAKNNLGKDCAADKWLCAIPIKYRNLHNKTTQPWKSGDTLLDWYGKEDGQGAGAEGSALDWTTNAWPAEWGTKPLYDQVGYGETPLNQWGHHYWLLDVDMDCSRTVNGWFELKSYISNGPGWENNVSQPGAPYSSANHFAQCGKINVFKRGDSSPVTIKAF